MEGKALLFKNFAGVDAFPICLDVTTPDEIVETVVRIAPVFGGINLEDIAAPACFEIEDRLKELLDIPVFHDDQHGTAVVALAALENALRIVDKPMGSLQGGHRRRRRGRAWRSARSSSRPAWPRSSASTARAPSGRAATTSTSPSCGSPSTPTPSAGRARSARCSPAPTCSSACRARASSRPPTCARWRPTRSCSPWRTPIRRSGPEEADGLAAVIATGPQRLPEPDQQRARLPGHLPRRARRGGHLDHRGHEAGRGPGHRRGGGRRRAPRLHRAVGVRHAGRAARGRVRRRGRRRRGRRAAPRSPEPPGWGRAPAGR